MPALITRYINTGSTAGGDGTTNATSGANRAWPTLNHALGELNTAYPSGLVAADVQVDLVCEGAADDSTALTNGWPTSDATRYIHWRVPDADRSVQWDASKYTYSRGGFFAAAVTVAANTVRITGIQVAQSGGLNHPAQHGLNFTGTGQFHAEGLKVAMTNGGDGTAVLCSAAVSQVVIRNLLVSGQPGGFVGFGQGVSCPALPSGGLACVYNATIVLRSGGGAGVALTFAAGSGRVARVKNCLIQRSSGITVTNADTDDQAGNYSHTDIDAVFLNHSTGDLRLGGTDTKGIDLGVDLSGVADFPFWIDAAGNSRVGLTWDRGAHEFGSTAPPLVGGGGFAPFMG